ncbi:hypothetical protein Tco_0155160 [Tanacetum coccineum]
MDDPNITMEEYIMLEEEKARRRAVTLIDEISSENTLSCKPTVSSLNNEVEFRISFDDFDDEDHTGEKKLHRDMALPPRDQRHQYLRYEGFQYTNANIVDFETRLARICKREVHRVQMFDFGGLLDLMAEGLSTRMLIEHKDAQGQSVFTSRAWRWLFHIRGSLVHELFLEFFSTFRVGETIRFGTYWAKSTRQIPDNGDLRDYWIRISSARDFLGIAPSYTSIRDQILRLCHRNLRLFDSGRKQGAMISRGKFVARLAERSLLMEERLQRLAICKEIDDTWDWVALGPERQPDAAAGTLGAAEDAPAVDKEEDVHKIHRALAEQREVIGAMDMDFSRFTVWAANGITQLLDSAQVTYMPYSETHVPYQKRVGSRTDGASTSAAQQDQQQPDP